MRSLSLEMAARLNPSDYESLENLAVAYRAAGRIADSERVLNAILKSGEEYAPAYNELGMAAFQKGDVAAAQGYFEKAARLDPTYQLNLGRFYKMAGDNARARAAFEAFLAARSSSAEYRQVIPAGSEGTGERAIKTRNRSTAIPGLRNSSCQATSSAARKSAWCAGCSGWCR